MGYQNLAKTLRNHSNLVSTPKKWFILSLQTIQDGRHMHFSIFTLYHLKFILSGHSVYNMVRETSQMYNNNISDNMADFEQIQDGRHAKFMIFTKYKTLIILNDQDCLL